MFVDYVRLFNREERIKYLFQNFQEYFGQKILDVGCDTAILKRFIKDKDIEYTGVDITGEPDIRLDLEKIEQLPFDESYFDCVICTDVLEHIENFHLIFSELIRVSKRYVVISWPNCWAFVRVPMRKGRSPHKSKYGLPAEKPTDRHKWFFNIKEAIQFVNEYVNRNENIKLIHKRACEKPRVCCFRWLRRIRYPRHEFYLNRYAHTLWIILEKLPNLERKVEK